MKISLENVQKSYSKRTVVNHVSLSVTQGEIVGLLGPNGAGKTTTFYMATGLEQPDEGLVWLDSRNITHLPLHMRARLGIGYLAQEASIFRHLTIRDNIRLILQQTGLPSNLQREKLEYLLKIFDLEHVASTLGIQVSGGERRRTELARALAAGPNGPKFLFLDEPFAGVDPIAVEELQSIILGLRERHIGLFITDHNVRETLRIIDRAYIMLDGRILASGSPEELCSNPLVVQYYLGQGFEP